MKGRGFLKVCGILMIIGGAISIIVSIIGLVGGIAIAATDYAAVGGVVIIAAIIALVAGVIELIAGILGVKNCDKPEKATSCIVFGIIVLVISIISLILTFSGGNFSAGTIILRVIFSIALPVLYLIGAFLNKQSA